VPARADHAHPGRRTELCHLLTNAARADNADRLVPDYYGIVSLMIETVALLVPVAQVKARAKWRKLANTYSPWVAVVSPREVVTETSEPHRSVSRKLLAPAGSSWTHFKRGARDLSPSAVASP